jgi:hypothetical protein
MKKIVSLSVVLAVFSLAVAKADVIADWTFQTAASTNNIIGAGKTPGATQSGVLADFGTGTASANHASSAAAWSIPAGNGSANSWSVNTWAVGDYFQFSVSTLDFQNITLSYDQVSSATGPGQFNLQYSTDGSTFIPFGSQYNVLVNSSPNAWSAGTPILTTSFSDDLSSITVLNNASTVYFRILDATTLSASQANGGSSAPAAAGTDRIDNFLVSATPVPEPSTLALAAFGGVAGLIAIRKRR